MVQSIRNHLRFRFRRSLLSLDAPVLGSNHIQWNAVQFTLDSGVLHEDDEIQIQITSPGDTSFSSVLETVTHSVTLAEILSYHMDLTAAPLPGDMAARARVVRNGVESPWSGTYFYTVPARPVVSAPTLTDGGTAGASQTLNIAFASPLIAGDTLSLQVQETGGDWSTLLIDVELPIAGGETALGIKNATVILPNGSFQARALGTKLGAESPWSTTLAFTKAGAVKTLLASVDNADSGTDGYWDIPINTGGKAGRLVVGSAYVDYATSMSAVFDPNGVAAPLTADCNTETFGLFFLSGNIPSVSGPTTVRIFVPGSSRWATKVGFVWLVEGLTVGKVAQAPAENGFHVPLPGVQAGDFVFSMWRVNFNAENVLPTWNYSTSTPVPDLVTRSLPDKLGIAGEWSLASSAFDGNLRPDGGTVQIYVAYR